MKVGMKVKANFKEIRTDFPCNVIGDGVGVILENDFKDFYAYKIRWSNGMEYYYHHRHIEIQPVILENK